ncbi:unnamed protein product [Sympodiomycopsis kandeliae]
MVWKWGKVKKQMDLRIRRWRFQFVPAHFSLRVVTPLEPSAQSASLHFGRRGKKTQPHRTTMYAEIKVTYSFTHVSLNGMFSKQNRNMMHIFQCSVRLQGQQQ